MFKLINSIDFKSIPKILASNEIDKQICLYADQRVDIDGIRSIQERISQSFERFVKNIQIPQENLEQYKKTNAENISLARKIEEKIFSQCFLSPKDIDTDAVEKLIPQLRKYAIN